MPVGGAVRLNETGPVLVPVPEESICLIDVAKPSQGKVPADLTLASAFSFCFQ